MSKNESSSNESSSPKPHIDIQLLSSAPSSSSSSSLSTTKKSSSSISCCEVGCTKQTTQTQYCVDHLNMHKLRVDVTTLALGSHELGLYATQSIEKDEVIESYDKVIQSDDYDELAEDNLYVIELDMKNVKIPVYVDGSDPTSCAWRYSNDNGNLDMINARYDYTTIDHQVIFQLIANRRINAGEEIFTRYGDKYWNSTYFKKRNIQLIASAPTSLTSSSPYQQHKEKYTALISTFQSMINDTNTDNNNNNNMSNNNMNVDDHDWYVNDEYDFNRAYGALLLPRDHSVYYHPSTFTHLLNTIDPTRSIVSHSSPSSSHQYFRKFIEEWTLASTYNYLNEKDFQPTISIPLRFATSSSDIINIIPAAWKFHHHSFLTKNDEVDRALINNAQPHYIIFTHSFLTSCGPAASASFLPINHLFGCSFDHTVLDAPLTTFFGETDAGNTKNTHIHTYT